MVHNPYVEFYFYDGYLNHFANILEDVFELFCTIK